MNDQQQAGQRDNAQPVNPGGANPSGGGQPSTRPTPAGGAAQQGASSQDGGQQDQSAQVDRQGTGLDEEDITESPRRDASSQPGAVDPSGAGGRQAR